MVASSAASLGEKLEGALPDRPFTIELWDGTRIPSTREGPTLKIHSPRAIGHVIVPTFAIRDEGTSYHYQPPSRSIEPTPDALEALLATLNRHDVPFETGGTWTTDAFYRETRAKVERRVAEGCLAVEMEASALFAIARFRGVPIAQLLTTSDDLSGEEWSGMRLQGRDDLRWSLFLLAAEAVRAL